MASSVTCGGAPACSDGWAMTDGAVWAPTAKSSKADQMTRCIGSDGDRLSQELAEDRHELVEMSEVDVVTRLGYRHHLDARVFASEPCRGFLGHQRRFCAGANDQRWTLHVANVLPQIVGIVG